MKQCSICGKIISEKEFKSDKASAFTGEQNEYYHFACFKISLESDKGNTVTVIPPNHPARKEGTK